MTTNENSFRTTNDNERTNKAAALVAKLQDAATAALGALRAAEASCAEDPTPGAFDKARKARRDHEDAERDLELARAHAAKVEAEIAAAEREAIKKDIAHREASLTEIVDDAAIEQVVELAIRCADIRQQCAGRFRDRVAQLDELNALRGLVGLPAEAVDPQRLLAAAVIRMGEVGLAAQAQAAAGGAHENLGALAGLLNPLPRWTAGNTPFGEIVEYVHGRERFFDLGQTSADGTQLTSGVDRTPFVREVAKLVERVKARRAALEKSGGTSKLAATVAKAAVAGAAVVAIASTVVGHG